VFNLKVYTEPFYGQSANFQRPFHHNHIHSHGPARVPPPQQQFFYLNQSMYDFKFFLIKKIFFNQSKTIVMVKLHFISGNTQN
jgi:hypothetical protein